MTRKTSRREFIKTTGLAVPMVLAGYSTASAATRDVFGHSTECVTVRNRRFQLRGRPYYFVGSSLWYGCYLGDPALPGGRQRLVRELDHMQQLGITNVRLLAGSETSPLAGAISRGITRGPRDWDEGLLAGLDFCLAEMAKRDMRAVLFLSNYWQWSGSFAQYVRWVTGDAIPDPDLPKRAAGDWHAFMNFSARFYNNTAANDLYRAYVSHLIRRRNTVNGRIYRDDPAIMTWELANEPRPGPGGEFTTSNLPSFYSWIDRTARFIHEQDPNHLVCAGSEGLAGCLHDPDIFIKTHESPAIDYVTVHLWLKNWSWLKRFEISPEYEAAARRGITHIESHIQMATDILRKPLVLEEFGFPRDGEKYEPDTPTTTRDNYYRRMFALVSDSCVAGRALQGANFWTWAGEGRARAGKGDAAGFTGDPLCEPQGLNSVFNTDKGTLAIIRSANERLELIAKRS